MKWRAQGIENMLHCHSRACTCQRRMLYTCLHFPPCTQRCTSTRWRCQEVMNCPCHQLMNGSSPGSLHMQKPQSSSCISPQYIFDTRHVLASTLYRINIKKILDWGRMRPSSYGGSKWIQTRIFRQDLTKYRLHSLLGVIHLSEVFSLECLYIVNFGNSKYSKYLVDQLHLSM